MESRAPASGESCCHSTPQTRDLRDSCEERKESCREVPAEGVAGKARHAAKTGVEELRLLTQELDMLSRSFLASATTAPVTPVASAAPGSGGSGVVAPHTEAVFDFPRDLPRNLSSFPSNASCSNGLGNSSSSGLDRPLERPVPPMRPLAPACGYPPGSVVDPGLFLADSRLVSACRLLARQHLCPGLAARRTQAWDSQSHSMAQHVTQRLSLLFFSLAR